MRNHQARPHDALYGVALTARNSHQINPHLPQPNYQAELLTVRVSGTSRRNVLGAIAIEKNDCNFPQRSDDNRDESKNKQGKSHDRSNAISCDEQTNQKKHATTWGATATQKTEGRPFLLDRLFQERSDTPMDRAGLDKAVDVAGAR